MQRRVRGFTLVELMVVTAIIGILAAISWSALSQVSAGSGPQNAINSFAAQLSAARLRALERQTNVWVILYPSFSRTQRTTTNGPGAYFVYEDRQQQFGRSTCTLSVCYSSFQPAGASPRVGVQGGTGDRLLEAVYLDDVAGQQTAMLRDADVVDVRLPAPLHGVSPSGCSFCTNGRGAIVFRPDGTARFVDGDGNPVVLSGGGTGSRVATLALGEKSLRRRYVVSVSSVTGYVGVHQP